MNDDKRAADRVAVNLSMRWHGASGQHEGRLEDLSVKGCFINTKGAVDVGEIVSPLIPASFGALASAARKSRFLSTVDRF